MTEHHQGTTTIAFIGLGIMDAPMAVNLRKAGFSVTAFDLAEAACDRVSSQGITVSTSAEAAYEGDGVVISMLSSDVRLACKTGHGDLDLSSVIRQFQ